MHCQARDGLVQRARATRSLNAPACVTLGAPSLQHSMGGASVRLARDGCNQKGPKEVADGSFPCPSLPMGTRDEFKPGGRKDAPSVAGAPLSLRSTGTECIPMRLGLPPIECYKAQHLCGHSRRNWCPTYSSSSRPLAVAIPVKLRLPKALLAPRENLTWSH